MITKGNGRKKGEINEGKETYSGDSYGGDPRDVPRGCTGNARMRNQETDVGAAAEEEKELTPEELEKKAEEDAYNMEIQSNGWKNWPQGPGTYGEAAIVMDAGTGSILYEKNIDAHEYPASITKVLTTLIALKYGKLSDPVTFTNDCVSFMQPGVFGWFKRRQCDHAGTGLVCDASGIRE